MENPTSLKKFMPLPPMDNSPEDTSQPVMTYWQEAYLRFRKNRSGMLGFYLLLSIILLALLGPLVSSNSYSHQFLDQQGLGPSRDFWFGTDTLGRDIFVRVFYGARISLSIGLMVSIINLTVGFLYGSISGLAGGHIDNFMMRVVDILYAIPLVLYVILLMVLIGPGLKSIFLALGLVYWVDMARIVRGQVLSLKEQEFILAARVLGARPSRIILRHLFPNCLNPIILTLMANIPRAIFTEAFLSFIGLGVSAPMASWGVLCADAMGGIRSYPHVLFFPAAAISITMLAFNLLGDGLRDALDPSAE